TGPIEYPAAAIKASKTPEQAQLFVQFLTDKEAQAILFRHGFKQ
ncbi:MAG: extracellular solute-binding protein, partial [Armatimonadetes bacterium]|nr:extracellular solute-binding protein [Akkermansiaceae bacterium]